MNNDNTITRKVKWDGVEYTIREFDGFHSDSLFAVQETLEEIKTQPLQFIFPNKEDNKL